MTPQTNNQTITLKTGVPSLLSNTEEEAMRNTFVVLCALVCMCAVGCSGAPALSMNKKMAYADSGATLATAVALDQVSQEKFDTVKAEMQTMCADVSKFLADGQVADLPLAVARQAVENYMIKKGWTAYISLVDVVFAWVAVQHVPTDKLGANNILIIQQGLDAVSRQAARAKKEWAVPFGTTNVDTTKGRSLTIAK